MNKSAYALNLNSDAFNAFKSDFDAILKKTLNTMLQKESESAELTAKIKITLTPGTAPDLEISAYHADREITSPKFNHKISSVMQIKDEKSGYVGGNDFELVWDREKGDYIMRAVKDAQRSLFEDDQPEEPAENGVRCLPAAGQETIDAEYTEVDEPGIVCEAKDNGTCTIIHDCGCCCVDCEVPAGCVGMCDIVKAHLGEPSDDDEDGMPDDESSEDINESEEGGDPDADEA